MSDRRDARPADRGRLRPFLALSAAAWIACAGCGGGAGGPGPTPSPGPTPTALATATPSPSPASSPSPSPSGPSTPFPIALGLEGPTGFAVGFGGDRYLVTLGVATSPTTSDVFGLRLTAEGEAVDEELFLVSDFGDEPFLPESDADYLPGGVAFARDAFGVFLYGYGLLPEIASGQVVGFVSVPPEGPPLLPATVIDDQTSFGSASSAILPPIAVTTNGTRFLGAYQSRFELAQAFSVVSVVGQIVSVFPRGIIPQRIGPFGGGRPGPGATSESAPGVAIGTTYTLLAWIRTQAFENNPDGARNVQGLLLAPDEGTFVDLGPTTIGSAGTEVASDGASGFLVVWTAATLADPSERTEIRVLRFTPGEAPEPAGGFLLAGGADAKALGQVVFAAGTYFVTWVEDGVVRGARLGTTGEEADVFTIDDGPATAVVATTDGARFLAVFDRGEGIASSDLFGVFLPAES